MGNYALDLQTPSDSALIMTLPIAKVTSAGDTRICQIQNVKGEIYGVFLEMDVANVAIRAILDGREISILDMSIEEMNAQGMDLPSPVFPYVLKCDSDTGAYNWVWTPRDVKTAAFSSSFEIEVAAGATVAGQVVYTKTPE